MNVRQHAFLVRALQDNCGGADNCVNLLENTPFAIGRTHMYRFRDPSSGFTMPIGAVVQLELCCGKPSYTKAICSAEPPPTSAECAESEAAELNYLGALLQKMVREAAPDGYSENERREIEPVIQSIENLARGVRAAMEAGASE